MMVVFTTDAVPFEWQIPGYQWALIIPLSLVVGCHILLPVRYCFVLSPLFAITLRARNHMYALHTAALFPRALFCGDDGFLCPLITNFAN